MLEDKYAVERARILAEVNGNEGDCEHPVFGVGSSERPVIMFIGEAPGKDEAACGRPFVGKAGKQLDEMLALAGIDRSAVFVTNAVKYRPIKLKNGRASNRTPKLPEIRAGLELLRYEIETVNPRVIATLGNTPLSAVNLLSSGDAHAVGIGASHGQPARLVIGGLGVILFPLYHPAACIYNRELKPVLEGDLIALGKFCGRI